MTTHVTGSAELLCPTGDDDWLGSPKSFGFKEYGRLALVAFGPPMALFIMGSAIVWATKGFREISN
jgi:hypothetical protein